MKKKIPKVKIKNLLFICYGNTCRSPMAEGLAKKILGDKANVESAGISPFFDSAAEKSIEVMEDLFGIDISNHRPRHIRNVSLAKFDFVIVLDQMVFNILKESYEIPSEKLIVWEIDDPFSLDLEAYRKCAEKIHHSLQDFLESN